MNRDINEKLEALRGAIREAQYLRPKKGELQCTNCLKIFQTLDSFKTHKCEGGLKMTQYECPRCFYKTTRFGTKGLPAPSEHRCGKDAKLRPGQPDSADVK